VEQGGLSHLSSRPQQVWPGILSVVSPKKDATDIIFSMSWLSQCEQKTAISSSGLTKNSVTFPQALQRYSYIGIVNQLLMIRVRIVLSLKLPFYTTSYSSGVLFSSPAKRSSMALSSARRSSAWALRNSLSEPHVSCGAGE